MRKVRWSTLWIEPTTFMLVLMNLSLNSELLHSSEPLTCYRDTNNLHSCLVFFVFLFMFDNFVTVSLKALSL